MMHDARDRAQALLRAAPVWDNHGCMPLRAEATFLPQLERYRAAGVSIVSLNVGFAEMSWAAHVKVLSFMRQWISMHPESFCLVRNVEDVRRCRLNGKLGVVFDIEGMCPVQDDLSQVQTFYDLGVRWMLIAYNRNNAAGGGCLDEDGGLTQLGRQIIDEMERVGMVLCLSHTGARTALEALEYSRNPVILSHSNPYAHTAHDRNVGDRLMRACAARGGVVGLSGFGAYLGGNDRLVGRLLEQLQYVIDHIGPDHVGLGLDYVFDQAGFSQNVARNPSLYPVGVSGSVGMVEPESIGQIAEGLASTNLTDDQIRGILGENWLRIATQVWH